MTGQKIINIILNSRTSDFSDEENWKNVEDIGLSDYYKEQLGEITVVSPENAHDKYWYNSDDKVVWHFKDHDVYIEGSISEGSYGTGYKLNTWDLKEVFPKKVEITIYE